MVGVILILGASLAFFGGSIERLRVDPKTGERYVEIQNKFLNAERLLLLAKNTSFFAIMAVGATLVIITAGIDLSVGSIYALAGLAGAAALSYFGQHPHLSAWIVVPTGVVICLGIGGFCGLANGLGVVALRLHPFIITLGTMGIFRGIAFVTTEAETIKGFHRAFVEGFVRQPLPAGWLPGAAGGLPWVPLAIMVLVGMWGTYLLTRTVTGRQIYAVGGNELAARYSGLPVGRLKVLCYTLAGLTAGVAAMINIGYAGAAASGDGKGYELMVIASAVVGGAGLSGGRGTALGAVLGALIIQMIADSIILLELDQNYSEIIIGAVIVLAAALDRWQTTWRSS